MISSAPALLAHGLHVGQGGGEGLLAQRRVGEHRVDEELGDAPEQHVVAAVRVAHVLPARHELEVGVQREGQPGRRHGQVREDLLAVRRALRASRQPQ